MIDDGKDQDGIIIRSTYLGLPRLSFCQSFLDNTSVPLIRIFIILFVRFFLILDPLSENLKYVFYDVFEFLLLYWGLDYRCD